MNWLKAMLLMVVLGAILYGVNLVLNKTAPVESPGNSGAWSGTEGAMTPPVVNRGTAGVNAPPGSVPPPYSPTPLGQSAYSSGNNSPPSSQVSSAGNVPPPATPSGYQASVYQPASPPIVNSDPAHGSIPATTAGLTTTVSNTSPNTPPAPASPTASGGDAAGGAQFSTAMDGIMTMLRDGKLAEGLQKLTLWCDARLSPEETKQRDDLLGRLAGTVVYSRQHLLLPPYEIKPGDRLETIANDYQVPARLLAKINGIGDPDHLTPGNQLKVIRGPFMALVSLNKQEVTLVVQQCYAGRFKLTGVGKEVATLNRVYRVESKIADFTPQIAGGMPPAINHWIGFGKGYGFCGMSDPNVADDPNRNDITNDRRHGLTLSSRDAEDLFDILTVGSTIVVR